ncbi:hypothetical protein ABZ341_42145 [Streptomyces sp. NPDC006173]|uniref:hypothetical protein n=1 Tax=Streptomyces sp. NPDC006173 TaxID=3155349 RepID=UPI00340C5506
MAWAVRSWVRASARRLRRRSHSPRSRWGRACGRSRNSMAVWSRNSPPCRWRGVRCEGSLSTGQWPLADSAAWECSSGPRRRRVLVRPGSEPT